MNKTDQAIELIEKEGLTVRQAARKIDISESAVHAAVKKRKAEKTGTCPCCGQKLPEKSN
jgi:predicted DNA-binding protein (UPF0251 family)